MNKYKLCNISVRSTRSPEGKRGLALNLRSLKVPAATLLFLLAVGCSSQVQPLPMKSEPIPSRPPEIDAGVVPYVWEEPMIDVVDVPPGLDPEGHYYRRAHQAVVEVRQGQWRPIDDGRRYRTR